MKFQEGDKIMVIATGEKGVVVEWINKKMLTIDVDGISFPVYADQIDFPYYSDFTASKPSEKQTVRYKKNPDLLPEKKVEKAIPKDGVWLSFFPVLDKDIFDEDLISHFRIYLLNHTDHNFEVLFTLFYAGSKHLEVKYTIRSLEDMYLFDLPFENLNDQPLFHFEFALQGNHKAGTHFVELKPKAKQIFKWAEDVLHTQQASFRMSLFEQFEGAITITKEEVSSEEKGIDLSGLTHAGFKVSISKNK